MAKDEKERAALLEAANRLQREETQGKSGNDQPTFNVPLGPDNFFAAIALAIVAVGLMLWFASVVPFPMTDPKSATNSTTTLAFYLARWGLVITLVGFVPILVAQVMTMFPWRRATALEAESISDTVWEKFLDALPGLLRTPVGIGVVLILLAVLLLDGAALGSKDNGSASPSQSPAASGHP